MDALTFEQLVARARDARAAGAFELAASILDDALDLWRGPPSADLAYAEFVQAERGRLEELRVAALEERVDVDLALGRHNEVVAELEQLVAEHPTRERLRAQHMLALYRSGRQTEALDSYRDLRRTLSAELGLEPGPELQRLERSILRQDDSLESLAVTEKAAAQPARRRRVLPAVAAAVALAALATTLAGVLLTRGDEPAEAAPVVKPAAGRTLAAIRVPLPACCGFGFGSVWAAGHHDSTVHRIDPETNSVTRRLPGVGWARLPRRRPYVHFRVDPGTNRIVTRIRGTVAVGGGYVWTGNSDASVSKVDPERNALVATYRLASQLQNLSFGLGSLWVDSYDASRVWRIDPSP